VKRIENSLSPTMVVVLTVAWLVLNQSVSPGHLLLGAALATAFTWLASSLRPLRARISRLDVAALLVLVVVRDIVASNLAVARIVLGLRRVRDIRSGFLEIPLDLRDPHGLAALAMIVTATPGTVWAGLSPDGDVLTLHVLDLRDEAALVRSIKERYERPLRKIFE